jgi:TRAP-type C4-dicarboxylate transport system substrate-binding protein
MEAAVMIDALRRATLALTLALVPAATKADPITLKLSFVTSDRSSLYQCRVKPFVDGVNATGTGIVQVKVYFSGAINPEMTEQARLVLDGTADLAYVVPGYSHQQFQDISVLELPGLFRDEREASLVFARLVAAQALEGYRKFFVVGAFVIGETIHSRKPIATLADLKGQTIRVNNEMVANAVRQLGGVPSVLPINRTMDALGQGKLDGVTVGTDVLTEFGFGRLTSHHYLLPLGGAPISLIMNREKLASLPAPAQELIRKYSGEWLSERAADCIEAKSREMVAQLKADKRRTAVEPSPADLATAQGVFSSVMDAWAAESPRNRELLALVRAELGKLRSPSGNGK